MVFKIKRADFHRKREDFQVLKEDIKEEVKEEKDLQVCVSNAKSLATRPRSVGRRSRSYVGHHTE